MPKGKLYYYGSLGYYKKFRELYPKGFDGSVYLVSEIKLPEKTRGKCAFRSLWKNRIAVGSVVDLVFGDPRILRRCTLISKDARDAPKEIRRGEKIWKFKYRGKYLWAHSFACIRVSRRKKQQSRRKK